MVSILNMSSRQQIFRHAELDRLYLSNRDFAMWAAGYLAVNCTIMAIWQARDPLQWIRTLEETTDVFGRSGSFYSCQTADDGSLPYAITLIAFHAFMLLLANSWSCKTREMQTEYNESRYIGYTLVSELEAIVVGSPFVILLDSIPPARFFVQIGLVFLTSSVMLCLIFLPKMRALRRLKIQEREERRQSLFSLYQERVQNVEFESNSGHDSNPEDIASNASITGEVNTEGVVALDRRTDSATEKNEATSGEEVNSDPLSRQESGLRVTHHPKVRPFDSQVVPSAALDFLTFSA